MATLVNGKIGTKVLIVSVDCSEQNELCNDESVTSLPTLKLFTSGDKRGIEYEGPRDLNSLLELLKKQMGVDVKRKEDVKENASGDANSNSKSDLHGDGDSEPLLNRENDDVLVDEPVSGLYELTEDTHKQFLSKGRHFVKFYVS